MRDNPTGVNIFLRTTEGKFLFQERDELAEKNPSRIAAFGGHIESGETAREAAHREMVEELKLVTVDGFMDIGIFESQVTKGQMIQALLLVNVSTESLTLHEGKVSLL